MLEYVRRSDLDNAPQVEKLTEADIQEVEEAADDYLVEAQQVCQEIERPIWRNTALERTAINAGESQQYPRAFSIARSIQNAEARSQALILVAESQCRHRQAVEATKTYAEVAEAVARVDQDGLRGVLTGYLVDSLISTGRFEDARVCLVLYPTASERFVAMGAIAESEARTGLRGEGPPVDRQRCAAGVPSGSLPPRQQRGTCQDRQLAAEPLLGPRCTADMHRRSAAGRCRRGEPERRAGMRIQRPGKNVSYRSLAVRMPAWNAWMSEARTKSRHPKLRIRSA